LNSLNLKNIAEGLIDTFLMAGKIAKEISKEGIKVKIKSDKSPVTNADIMVNEILTKKIKNLTPNIPVVSEETVEFNSLNNNTTFWLIDPIDGTRDYISKKEEYTLNAALIIDNIPSLGVIYAPAKDRLFYSYGKNLAFEINKGVKKKLNCKKVNANKIIGLENSEKTPIEVLNIYKKYNVSKILKISSSIKFCILAAGEADIYAANARAFEWDIAAGHAILEHAGGTITKHDGEKFLYGKENYKNQEILAKRKDNLEK